MVYSLFFIITKAMSRKQKNPSLIGIQKIIFLFVDFLNCENIILSLCFEFI